MARRGQPHEQRTGVRRGPGRAAAAAAGPALPPRPQRQDAPWNGTSPPTTSGRRPSSCSAPSASSTTPSGGRATTRELAERLQNLARPALGHWWEFVRRLRAGPGRRRRRRLRAPCATCSWAARATTCPAPPASTPPCARPSTARPGARATVRLTELFDRLVRYRNQELGHGAAGQRARRVLRPAWAGRCWPGVAEVLGRLDVLAGRRLVTSPRSAARPSGAWLVERYELTGEIARRLESLELPEAEAAAPAPPGAALPGRPAARDPSRRRLCVAAPAGGLRRRGGRGAVPQRPPRQAAGRVPVLHAPAGSSTAPTWAASSASCWPGSWA